MANLALTDAHIYYGDTDLTGYANQVGVELTRDALDNTTFANAGYRSRIGGMHDGSATASGFHDLADGTQVELFSRMDGEGIFTVGPQGDAVGAEATTMKVRQFTYSHGAQIGELYGFNISAQVSDGVGSVSGQILVPKSAISATANGTAVQVGAIAADEVGYGVLHVFSGTASTLDVKIQSDDGSGMASPTDRITFTQATGPTSQWSTVAGAVTDDYWRAVYTLGGGTWNFSVFFGIK